MSCEFERLDLVEHTKQVWYDIHMNVVCLEKTHAIDWSNSYEPRRRWWYLLINVANFTRATYTIWRLYPSGPHSRRLRFYISLHCDILVYPSGPHSRRL